MIKTKVAFLESRLLPSQSDQFENFSKSSDWLEKSRLSKKLLLFWSCKQAKYVLTPWSKPCLCIFVYSSLGREDGCKCDRKMQCNS